MRKRCSKPTVCILLAALLCPWGSREASIINCFSQSFHTLYPHYMGECFSDVQCASTFHPSPSYNRNMVVLHSVFSVVSLTPEWLLCIFTFCGWVGITMRGMANFREPPRLCVISPFFTLCVNSGPRAQSCWRQYLHSPGNGLQCVLVCPLYVSQTLVMDHDSIACVCCLLF